MRCTSVIESCSDGGGSNTTTSAPAGAPARWNAPLRKTRRWQVAAEFVIQRRIRRGLAEIALDQQMHAAARAAGGDGTQAFHRGIAEGRGKPGDHDEAVFLGDGAGLFVVGIDVRELVAEIHLDDFFDVIVDLGEALLDVGGLRPDPVIDERFLVIRQMHQPGEVLAESHGIDEHERGPARRMRG